LSRQLGVSGTPSELIGVAAHGHEYMGAPAALNR
jgi:hypothetical protein